MKFRFDIQGLRAIAVIVVVADHLYGWPLGGFVGVDVFFVISGYLITSHLLREQQKSGKISMGDFVRKRIRRILPASAVTLLVTVTASYFVLGQARFESILQDGIFASLLSANWRFAVVGTDYFASNGPVSPLQHFWSLAVEEQFYLFWPLLVMLVCALVAKRARRTGRAANWQLWVFMMMCTVIVLSLAWAFMETATTPGVAYFSTLSRAWELAIGAALAGLLTWRPLSLGPAVSTILVWAGTVGLVASVLIVPASPGFPAPWALLPVLSTAIVILGGAGAPALAMLHLTNPPMRYVGNISYSLYLWHFPVLILGIPLIDAYIGPDFAFALPMVLVGGFILAMLSYHFVEEPVRRSHWLLPQPGRLGRGSSRLAVSAAVICTALVVASVVSGGRTSVSDVVAVSPGAGAAELGDENIDGLKEALAAEISASLAMTYWPGELTPSIAEANSTPIPPEILRCGKDDPASESECTFGSPDATKKAYLVGDSISLAYAPALLNIFGTGDWSLRILAMYECPYVDLRIGSEPAKVDSCEKRRGVEDEAIAKGNPDLVIISNTYFREKDSDTGVPATREALKNAFEPMIQRVASGAKSFVLLPPPVPGANVQKCYSPLTGPEGCVSRSNAASWLDMAEDQRKMVEDNNGHFIDNRYWYCDGQGLCPPFVGNVLVKRDLTHPTLAYVEKIAPLIRNEFERIGIVGDAPAADTPAEE